jgi:hypothetical protein
MTRERLLAIAAELDGTQSLSGTRLMTKLAGIRIESSPMGLELRLDWDNDWHQAIPVEALDPEHISLALMEAARAMIRSKLPNDLPCEINWKGEFSPVACIEEDPFEEARTALSQPEPLGPTDEELLAVQVEGLLAVQAEGTVTFPLSHPEAEALSICEYYKQLEIRKGRAVLQRWGRSTPQPIPVSERLPGPEDCDAEGRCWFWEPDCDYNGLKWALVNRTYGCNAQESVFTHWLPFHALPLPSPNCPQQP